MNTRSLLVRLCAALTLALTLTAGQLGAQVTTFNDATNDIAPGISTGGGTLDIVSMEVSDSVDDVIFKMTVNGNITTTDWGNFMIGVSTGTTTNTNTGNGWNRPVDLNATNGGMTHWIGSWVNGGGGSQLWTYTGSGTGGGTSNNWSGPTALTGFSFATNTNGTSTISYIVSKASLGTTDLGDVIAFDAYSSGSGGGDTAIDALSNPDIAVTAWNQPYTSSSPKISTYVMGNTASPITNTVTFSVDMSALISVGAFDPFFDIVSVAGSFNGFNPSANTLEDVGGGIYETTIPVVAPSGTLVTYRYVIDSGLFEPETVGRSFPAGSNPTPEPLLLPTVYFDNIEGYRDVTFTVDMSEQITLGNFDPATQTVEVRGAFNNWGGTSLDPLGGGLYGAVLTIGGAPDQVEQYKFYTAGPDAVGYEQGSNRNFTLAFNPDGLPDPALVLPTASFLYETRNISFSVDMSVQEALGLFDPATGVVQLRGIGGFGEAEALELTREGETLVYSGTFAVPGLAGATFDYKFFSAGINYFVESDAANQGYEIINQADPFQNRQAVLGANAVEQVLDQPYFSNQLFGVLGTTTDPLPDSGFIPFSATQGTPSPAQSVGVAGLGLAGDIVATAPTGFEVSSDGTTFGSTANIVPTTGSVSAANLHVRVAASAPFGPISGRVNLTSTASQNTSIAVSANVTPSSETRDVTFSVDMSVQIALGNFNPTGGVVEVRGSFNGFAGGDALTAQGNGIYTGTFPIVGVAGVSTYAYKFYAANAGSDPVAPGFEGGSDRTFTVGAAGQPQILPSAFFSNAGTRDVTFSVDMSVQIGLGNFNPVDGVVEVRGPFNDWAGTVLTADENGIYSGTVNIAGAEGDSVAYKFFAANPDTDPAVPGYETNDNRTFLLGPNGVPQILPTAFFSNDSGQMRDVNFSVDMSVQISLGNFDPATGVVEVRGPFNGWNGTALTAQGAGIYSGTVSIAGPAGETEQYKFWATGLEWEIIDGDEFINRTFILGPSGVLQILPTVFFSNNAGGQTFTQWSGGLPLTSALELEYAIGGASAPGAGDGVPSVTTLTADTLSITAMVRTNDPTLTVTGQALVNLAVGPWSTNNVTVTVVDPQPLNVPEGCQAQTFSTPRGPDGKKFLRLQTTLPAAP